MTIVRRTSPFGELMSLRSAMDRPRQIRISAVTNGTAIASSAGGEKAGEKSSTEQSPAGAKV